jgi:mannitol/fructose-specific phosphotransferase system IIA component (Ntr-type)
MDDTLRKQAWQVHIGWQKEGDKNRYPTWKDALKDMAKELSMWADVSEKEAEEALRYVEKNGPTDELIPILARGKSKKQKENKIITIFNRIIESEK